MLLYLHPPPSGFIAPSQTELPPPIYFHEPLLERKIDRLSIVSSINGHSLPPNGHAPLDNVHGPLPNGNAKVSNGHTPSQTAPTRSYDPGGSEIKPSDWVWVRLTQTRRVSAEGWWQNVREIELEFEDPDM